MKKLLLPFVLFLALLVGCGRPQAHARPHKPHATKSVKVAHLSDGRVVYRGDDGMFWFYMYMMHSNTGGVYSSGNQTFNYYTAESPNAPLPTGGAWVPATVINPTETPTTVEQQMEFAFDDPRTTIAETPAEVDAGGSLMSPTEVQTEFSYNETTNELSVDNSTGESTSESSPSSDSGSSGDSGSAGGDSGSSGGDSGSSSGPD